MKSRKTKIIKSILSIDKDWFDILRVKRKKKKGKKKENSSCNSEEGKSGSCDTHKNAFFEERWKKKSHEYNVLQNAFT